MNSNEDSSRLRGIDRKYLIGGILVVLVLAVGVGAAVYYGVGPAPGGESSDPIEDFPVGTPAEPDSETAPFTFTIDDFEECGATCRDVTATLHNQQDEAATDVTVYTRVFAGENNTDTDDLVWEGTEAVGTIEAGASYTSTERVELSLQEARKVDKHDGWVTIVTTVESNEVTVTFQDSEQVA